MLPLILATALALQAAPPSALPPTTTASPTTTPPPPAPPDTLLVDYAGNALTPWDGDADHETLMCLQWAFDHEPGDAHKRAVFVFVHGGWGFFNNQANAVPPPGHNVWLAAAQARTGCVVAYINYPLLQSSSESLADGQADVVARAVQFLRHHADALAIDPDLVVVAGTSHGGLLAFDLALRADRAVPGATRIEKQSSRPDFVIVSDAPTLIPLLSASRCVTASGQGTGLGYLTHQEIPAFDAQRSSPLLWLTEGRVAPADVPPLCLVYSEPITPVGTPICDVHDGAFGLLMWQAVLDAAHPDVAAASAYVPGADPHNKAAQWLNGTIPQAAQGAPPGPGIGGQSPNH